MNKKLDEKLDTLMANIENNLFKQFLKPSLNSLEETMKYNLRDIKNDIDCYQKKQKITLDFSLSNNSKDLRNKEITTLKSKNMSIAEILIHDLTIKVCFL